MHMTHSQWLPLRYLTIRGLSTELARALEQEKRRRGGSLNQTVLDLLRQCLGLGPGRGRSNGLAKLAGTWSAREHARFESGVDPVEQVDAELWR